MFVSLLILSLDILVVVVVTRRYPLWIDSPLLGGYPEYVNLLMLGGVLWCLGVLTTILLEALWRADKD